MTADQELAALCEDFSEWRIWRGRDANGAIAGWHATRRTPGGTTILAADGPAELRHRLEQTQAKDAAPSHV